MCHLTSLSPGDYRLFQTAEKCRCILGSFRRHLSLAARGVTDQIVLKLSPYSPDGRARPTSCPSRLFAVPLEFVVIAVFVVDSCVAVLTHRYPLVSFFVYIVTKNPADIIILITPTADRTSLSSCFPYSVLHVECISIRYDKSLFEWKDKLRLSTSWTLRLGGSLKHSCLGFIL